MTQKEEQRYKIVVQLFRTLSLLLNGWTTIGRMAAALDVTDRTVYRIIKVIESLGFSIEKRPVGRQMTYRLVDVDFTAVVKQLIDQQGGE